MKTSSPGHVLRGGGGSSRRLLFVSLVTATSFLVAPVAAITPDALAAALAEPDAPKIVDVRPTHEFEVAHIPGSLNIPAEIIARRQLPPFGRVVVVADGRGIVDAEAAAAVLRQNSGNTVDVLEGGFSAWESGPRPTTQRGGLAKEVLPGITYQQLVDTREAGIVLVDLRDPLEARAQSKIITEGGSLAAAAASGDLIGALARKLPDARVSADPFGPPPEAGARAASASKASDSDALSPAPMAAAVAGGVPPLLVLIDNNDGRAQETARRLIARGNRRFVILSGGIDAVILQGEGLVERTGGTISGPGGASQ